MPRQSNAPPEHIHRRVGKFVVEITNNADANPAAIKKLRRVIASTKPEMCKIWLKVDSEYAPRTPTTERKGVYLRNRRGDGQEWLCRAIMAAIPEPRLTASTKKEAQQWQAATHKKLRELDRKLAELPECCSRLPNRYAEKVIAQLQTDGQWLGSNELLAVQRPLRRLLFRYRTLLQQLQEAVSDPTLIPDDFDFDVRPNSRTNERNQFIRELSQAFRDELGKPKRSWVAEIAAAIYGGQPDTKEVRRQMT